MNIGAQTDDSRRLTLISRTLCQCDRLRQIGTTFSGWFNRVQVSDPATFVAVLGVLKGACATHDMLMAAAPQAGQ
jgi:hypothetical protein